MLKCADCGYIFSQWEKIESSHPKEAYFSMDKSSQFHMEAAGSLTPELDGAPRSGLHQHRTQEKGRRTADEARQKAVEAPLLETEQTR